jgi:hypothetical protein
MVAGAAMLVWVPPCAAIYLPDERVSTDDPLYRDLERLAARFGDAPRFLSSRPLRRAEALGYLEALSTAHADAADDPAYLRARRALVPDAPGGKPALITARGENGERAEISPYVSLLYTDDPRNRPDVNRDYRAGVFFAGALDSSVTMATDLYAGTSSQGGRGTPNFGTFNAVVEGVDFNTWLGESYLEARAGRVRFLAGHTWLRWGPGHDGTLALSDAAPALDMVRAEVTAFRAWRLQWFVSILDPGPQAYLAGHRLEWSPSGRLTAGFTELARFDGTSQAPLYAMPLVPYSFWEKRPKTSAAGAIPGDSTGVALAKNNVLWSADLAWTPRAGWRAWGEFMVDDISFSNDYKPDMIGYQGGIEHRCAVRGGRDALGGTIEYNRVNNFTYSAFHGHHFENEGFPLGFVLGPDVAAIAGEITYERGAAWEFALRGEWRKKGEGQVGDFYDKPAGGTTDASAFEGVVSEEARLSGEVTYHPTRQIRLVGAVGTSSTTNFRHASGVDHDAQPLSLRGEFRW